ncbi:MAG: M28 family peptidase [Bacteroidales bacterium]|nr:M28 family peptidase [Bacteroidales bacterium]MCF8336930.1 M28 family peptidase [Bacteroidales bacterium]
MRLAGVLITITIFAVTACITPDNEQKETSSGEESEEKQASVNVPEFNADSAFHFVKKQTDFGPRVPNTKAHTKCADYLAQKMKGYADTVIVQQSKVRAYNNDILNIKNIISVFNPGKTKRILLGAHWDSRPYADHDPDKSARWEPIQGANDGASGVGVLMELARILAKNNPDLGVDIIFFDAEDYGPPESDQSSKQDTWGLGSQYWAKNPHNFGYDAHYGILLDMVGAENAQFPKERFSTYYAPDVVDKVWNIADKAGYGKYFPDKEGGTINDDHYFINKIIGIPMINIIHLNPESENGTFFKHWHTKEDTIDKISPETLKVVGAVVLNVIFRE